MTATTNSDLTPAQAVAETMARRILEGRTFLPPGPDAMPGDDPAESAMHAARVAGHGWICRVPGSMLRASMATLDQRQYPARLRTWIEHPDARTLLLVGDVGVGKSWAAAAVAQELTIAWHREFRLRGTPLEWWSVAGLLDELRPSAAGGEDVWERVKAAPILVLDDLAHVRPTEWAAERMWMLANARAETPGRLRTIVTANASWEDLAGSWGPGTMDRLRDGAAFLTLTGASRRRPVDLTGGPR